ncbi:hypothetical protein TI05_17825, partial [Achromatium sp. WMS3]
QLGQKLRAFYYTKRAGNCGKNLRIDEGVIIQGIKDIYFGDNVWVDKYCILMAGKVSGLTDENCLHKIKPDDNNHVKEGELRIGSNVHITPYCLIQAHGGIYIGNHVALTSGAKLYSLSNLPTDPTNKSRIIHMTSSLENEDYLMSNIIIENNVVIGINSIVLPGVIIEKNSFVAPNSLVITRVQENSFMAGNPAKKIKDRFSDYETER